MPANLPPQYYEAEKRFRDAREPEEKIAILEEMLAIMPKHKGTDHLKADLRHKIAKLSETVDNKIGSHRVGVVIPKEGVAQVVIIGLPNSGKSQLVSTVTNAVSAVADYPFTTQQAIPGMMEYGGVKIQLIDTPPFTADTIEWWLPNMVKRADAAMIVVDLNDNPAGQMETVIAQMKSKRVELGTLRADNPDEGIFYQKALLAGNKVDLAQAKANVAVLESRYQGKLPVIAISAKEGTGLEDLKATVFKVLDLIRVYTKAPGQKADLRDPIAIPRGSTLEDAARAVHKDFVARLKFARVWGAGKYDGLRIGKEQVLEDGDIIELHIADR